MCVSVCVPECVESLQGLGQCTAGLQRDRHRLLDQYERVPECLDPAARVAGCRPAAGGQQGVGETLQAERELLQAGVHAEEAGRACRAFWETGAVAAGADVTAGAGNAWFTEARTRAFIAATQHGA